MKFNNLAVKQYCNAALLGFRPEAGEDRVIAVHNRIPAQPTSRFAPDPPWPFVKIFCVAGRWL